MSTFVLKTETFEKISNSNHMISKACYGKTIYFDEFLEVVNTWQRLNIRSYNIRYPEDIITSEEEEIFYKIDSRSKEKFNNIYELLKSLQCLRYNIDFYLEDKNDIEKISHKEEASIQELESYIRKIKDYIIFENEEYKIAAWE